MMVKEKYRWLFSDTEFNDGKIDIHFILNTQTGEIEKIIQRRTQYKNNVEEELIKAK